MKLALKIKLSEDSDIIIISDENDDVGICVSDLDNRVEQFKNKRLALDYYTAITKKILKKNN